MLKRLNWRIAMRIGWLRDQMRRWTRPSTRPVLGYLLDRFRSREELVRENALLRKQLEVAYRQIARPRLTWTDRAMLVLLSPSSSRWQRIPDSGAPSGSVASS